MGEIIPQKGNYMVTEVEQLKGSINTSVALYKSLEPPLISLKFDSKDPTVKVILSNSSPGFL